MEKQVLKYIGKRLKELDLEFKKCKTIKQREINIAKVQELKQVLELWIKKED